jgi:DNA polymerase-3 subunit gamma/tau
LKCQGGLSSVFENIIAQAATDRLKEDILSRKLAPSMLFFGPEASGKGSAAIELARVLSCENAASWNCGCPSCARHRMLIHADLAMLGPRNFAAETAAARAAFLRDPTSAAGRSLFIRSVRKLLARFSPAVWEYKKRGEFNPLPVLQSLEDGLDEFESLSSAPAEKTPFEKLTRGLLEDAVKLEDGGVSEAVPVAQVRKAAYWCRLAPSGKRKILIIENADRMEDEARNSLLKLLEEPPETVSIVLTARRREAVLPTILSRLRPYRFLARGADQEREIIRRVFRDVSAAENIQPGETQKTTSGLVKSYLDSFLPQPPEKLLPLAAFFVAAVSRSAAAFAKSRGVADGTNVPLPPALQATGGYCAPLAEAAGFERTTDAGETIEALLSGSGKFEGRSFPRFLALVSDLVSRSLSGCDYGFITCGDIWRKRLTEAQAANGVWNQRPELALESLFYRLREELAV